jgi:UDP-N-acetylglucosamine 1-carboxyvinyltransferase
MDRIIVRGGARLVGDVAVSGSKNSTLALMAAALLPDGETVLHNVPRLRDVDTMLEILRSLGAGAEWVGEGESHTVRIDARTTEHPEAPYELVRRMRASFLVLGPLLARFGTARVSEPGGCAIGVRPVDQHMKGLAALGAKIKLDHGYVEASTPNLAGGTVAFDLVTVNGTQNVMMAATRAKGVTVIENAAREPEVTELAELLNAMGADVRDAGTDRVTIHGVASLKGIEHTVAGDRIEAGTLIAAAMVTHGNVRLSGIDPGTMDSTIVKLREAGAQIEATEDGLRAAMGGWIRPVRAVTAPYPGYPTDMQAQLMAVLTLADGTSEVTERVFENRFMHVPELQRMGAQISLSGQSAHIRGVPRLMGAPVMATDLRASAGLVVAALAAEGDTEVNRVYHIDRGYERIEAKLRGLGADIRRES